MANNSTNSTKMNNYQWTPRW